MFMSTVRQRIHNTNHPITIINALYSFFSEIVKIFRHNSSFKSSQQELTDPFFPDEMYLGRDGTVYKPESTIM